jgi:hypothetical protein
MRRPDASSDVTDAKHRQHHQQQQHHQQRSRRDSLVLTLVLEELGAMRASLDADPKTQGNRKQRDILFTFAEYCGGRKAWREMFMAMVLKLQLTMEQVEDNAGALDEQLYDDRASTLSEDELELLENAIKRYVHRERLGLERLMAYHPSDKRIPRLFVVDSPFPGGNTTPGPASPGEKQHFSSVFLRARACYRAHLTTELHRKCCEVIALLKKFVMPHIEHMKPAFRYLKVCADLYRYMCEHPSADRALLEQHQVCAVEMYKQSFNVAQVCVCKAYRHMCVKKEIADVDVYVCMLFLVLSSHSIRRFSGFEWTTPCA